MIFPLSSIWFGSTPDDHVARRVDRYEDSKRNRMGVGIHCDSEFRELVGTLLIVSGHGKYLHPRSWSSKTAAIPSALSERLIALQREENPCLLELSNLRAELSLIQGQLVGQLKEQAGKYVDRILAVSIRDPGLWVSDFDETPIYYSLCDPDRLSQVTGLNVIDAFPTRDLAGGGTAKCLEALPLWLMAADRDSRAASNSRVVAMVDSESKVYYLPGSDGLDAELPMVRQTTTHGMELFRQLAAISAGQQPDAQSLKQTEFAAINGRQIKSLIEEWHRCDQEVVSMMDIASRFVKTHEFADILRSCVVFVADQLMNWLKGIPHELPTDRILISGDNPVATLLVNELTRRVENEDSLVVDATENHGELQAILSAILGFLTIDQMPASLPWITGCTTPQVLGKVTAGRPTAWRSLLVEMADYRPPVMKLKDAI